jgi:hypothetical protein
MSAAPHTYDFKIEACIEYANSSFHTPKVRMPAIKSIVELYRYNVVRTRYLMLMPALIGDQAFSLQRSLDIAEFQIFGNLSEADRPQHETSRIQCRSVEIFNKNTADGLKMRETGEWDRFVYQKHKEGIIPALILSKSNHARAMFEAMINAYIISAWTAIETLLGDLWEESLNIDPHGLAHLNGKPVSSSKDGRNQEKAVAIDIISEHNFDLSHVMGSVLRRRFEFSRLENARQAYALAFSSRNTKVIDAINSKELDALCVIRNLLVHKSGIADDLYIKHSNRLRLPKAAKGDVVNIDGEIAISIIKPAFECGSNLLAAVDEWLKKSATAAK